MLAALGQDARSLPTSPTLGLAAGLIGGGRAKVEFIPKMLFTLETSHEPATELGFLLGKHPDKLQSFDLSHGKVHVFFPHASPQRCQAALLLEVDPVELVRGRGDEKEGTLERYVNDRPYTASSFLCVAFSRVLGSALGGRCKERPALAQTPIPLEARLSALRCRGGEAALRRLFEPLGYEVEARHLPLDEAFPAWGEGSIFAVTLRRTATVSEFLSQLYVLIPVLDGDKHYFVGPEEIEKLVERGGAWLPTHPARGLIVERYLKRQGDLAQAALARLQALADAETLAQAALGGGDEEAPEADAPDGPDAVDLLGPPSAPQGAAKPKERLHDQRLAQVAQELRASGITSLADLGCGEGRLLQLLKDEPQFRRLVGVDVSMQSLQWAKRRLGLERHEGGPTARVELLHGSLLYHDARWVGVEGACLVEVIEHLEPSRLESLERVVFGGAGLKRVWVTTPNRDYNALYPALSAGKMRHSDHRFEWSRAEFSAWAQGVAGRYGYEVGFAPLGPLDAQLGAPTQMARFTKMDVTSKQGA